MDSVRDEVLAAAWDAYCQAPAMRDMGRSKVDAAVKAALKRGSGVVVRELEWSLEGDTWVARPIPCGIEYTIVEIVRGSWRARFNRIIITHTYTAYSSFEAAKAACQADFAKRITSAVEPSCVVRADLGDAIYQAIRTRVGDHAASQIADTVVEEVRRAAQPSCVVNGTYAKFATELTAARPSCVVTDEMVEAAWSAFVGAGEDWRDGAVRRRGALDKAALRAALTAALSSRTEEEVRADERERLAKEFERQANAATEAAYAGNEPVKNMQRGETLKWFVKLLRARSLTNGGE